MGSTINQQSAYTPAPQASTPIPEQGQPSERQVQPAKAQTQQQPALQFSSEIEELNKLVQKVAASSMPRDLSEKAITMISRIQKIIKYGSFAREYEPVEKFIDWITRIPWGSYTDDNLELQHVKAQLDKTHYGVDKIKERILEYVAMLNLITKQQKELALKLKSESPSEMAKLQGSSSHAPIICLVGIQGIGKTSIAKSISTALGRRFVRISLGGLSGASELRGRSRGETDAEPGQVIKALVRSEVMNPMILLDEIDKISETGRADIMAALLEILDPEQNSTFRDNYIDYPVNLSRTLFITTANNLGGISAALLDRLEIIRMLSYTDDEKTHIGKDYLLPKVMANSGLKPGQIEFDDDVWPMIIRPLGFDAGIRELERTITNVVRKVAKKIVTGEGTMFKVTSKNFREYIPEDIGILS